MQLKKVRYFSIIMALGFMLFSSLITSCSSPTSDSSSGTTSSGSSNGGNGASGGNSSGGSGSAGSGGSGGGSGTVVTTFASIENPITLNIPVPYNATSVDIIRRRVNENHSAIQGEDWKMIASATYDPNTQNDPNYVPPRSTTKVFKDYYEVTNGYHYEYKINVKTVTDTNGSETTLGYHQATYNGLQAPDLKTTDNAYPEIHFDSQNGRKMKLLNKDNIGFIFHNNETMNNWTLTMHYNYFNYCAWFNGSKDAELISDEAWNKFTTHENKMHEFYIKIQFQNEEYARVFYKDPASLNHQKIDEKIVRLPEVNPADKTVKIRVRIQPDTRDLNIQRREKPANDTGWAQSYDSTETVGRLTEDQFTARKKDGEYLEFIDKWGLEDGKIYQYRFTYRTGNDLTWHEIPLGELHNESLTPNDGRVTPGMDTISLSWQDSTQSLQINSPASIVGSISGQSIASSPFDIALSYTKSGGGGGFWPVFKLNIQNPVTAISVTSENNLGSTYTLNATDSALIVYDDEGGQNGNGGIAHFFKKGVDQIHANSRTLTK